MHTFTNWNHLSLTLRVMLKGTVQLFHVITLSWRIISILLLREYKIPSIPMWQSCNSTKWEHAVTKYISYIHSYSFHEQEHGLSQFWNFIQNVYGLTLPNPLPLSSCPPPINTLLLLFSNVHAVLQLWTGLHWIYHIISNQVWTV